MSGLLSCAYELLEKNLITATVLVLGIPLIIFFIPKVMNSSLSNPFEGVVIQKLSPWRQTLTGETINLPNEDVQGFAISRETSHIVYSMPCSSCSKPEEVNKYLMQSVKSPSSSSSWVSGKRCRICLKIGRTITLSCAIKRQSTRQKISCLMLRKLRDSIRQAS